ncbi:MAG: helix-turn-helix domain-containing protein [Actinomycetota bacterium]|nr:helix-turn-helix domain-containing protein [Actinomycetota bacterium]
MNDLVSLNLLSVPQIAAILNVSKRTVYRMVENGDLQAYKIGQLLRVPESEVARYLRAHRKSRCLLHLAERGRGGG